MNKIVLRIFFCVVCAMLLGCTRYADMEIAPDPGIRYTADGRLLVRLGMEMPGMVTATRALGETPNYSELTLYVFVFEQDKGLRQYEKYECEPEQDGVHQNGSLVTFDIELNPTEKATTIHLVATNQPGFEKNMGYGTEDMLISSLYTTCAEDGTAYEAYWQRICFEHNIPSAEQAGKAEPTDRFKPDEESKQKAEKIIKSLNHVPMIRNFCRVSVEVAAAVAGSFKVTGLYVVNTVDRGAVAPYVVTRPTGERFIEYCKKGTDGGYVVEDGKYVGKSYAEISELDHVGTLPVGVQLINSDVSDKTGITTKSEFDITAEPGGSVSPVYFYERPARTNSTQRTYVIIRGIYSGADGSGKETFYKIDLGYIDESVKTAEGKIVGVFAYYNLLRNFDYHIRINQVESDGYSSFKDAADGAVFNNFSAAVEARNMISISDGEDMIFVHFHDGESGKDYNFTSYVFTQPDEVIDLLAQFRTGITNGTGGKEENNLIDYYLEPGDVVKGVTATTRHNPTGFDAWNTYTVSGTDPTDQLRQQTMYVFRGNKAGAGQPADYGLYRMITFFSHIPWSFVHMDTFPGLWNDFDEAPWDWSNEWREIGQSAGSPLTLFFELPAGLPQAIFPLEFVIESDRQNIQNAYAGNAVVRSVSANESLFYAEGAADNPMTSRIQYVKTVTWDDYFGGWSEELVGRGSSVVRCRFLTITDLAQDGIGVPDEDGASSDSKSQTRLRVANPYFGVLENGQWQMYHEDGFERTTRTSDPSPRSWNFSSPLWSSVLSELTGTRSTRINGENVDKLELYEANTYSLGGGTYDVTTDDGDPENPVTETYYFIQASKAGTSLTSGDRFRYKHSYPAETQREIRVAVMATDANGNVDKDNLVNIIVNGTGGSVTLQSGYPKIDESTKPFPTLIYQYDVEARTTEVQFAVTPKKDAPTRFYEIDFFPRWDEVPAEPSEGD